MSGKDGSQVEIGTYIQENNALFNKVAESVIAKATEIIDNDSILSKKPVFAYFMIMDIIFQKNSEVMANAIKNSKKKCPIDEDLTSDEIHSMECLRNDPEN